MKVSVLWLITFFQQFGQDAGAEKLEDLEISSDTTDSDDCLYDSTDSECCLSESSYSDFC
jgi:hypothetical protein